jgi:uncharacterized protein YjlB
MKARAIDEHGLVDLVQKAQERVVHFSDDGLIPNNPKLPLVIYRRALKMQGRDAAGRIEELVAANEWGGTWRNGIYGYHHYHSTAHEVLLVYCGSAGVQLGGESGVVEQLETGDVLIIPAGVAHKNLGSSNDFAVIGAYPEGQEWDICYGKPEERLKADENIARVPLPKSDPVYGADGPLLRHWR